MTIAQGVQAVAISEGQDEQQNYDTYQWQTQQDDRKLIQPSAILVDDFESRRQSTPKQYQDVVWAMAFVLHLIVIIAMILLGLQSDKEIQAGSYSRFMSIVCVTGVTAVVSSTCALSFMISNAILLVQVALVFSVCTSLVISVIGFMSGSMLMGAIGFISFAIGICYANLVWGRIPFAAANLSTALTAVQSNLGLVLMSIGFTVIAFAWSILWFFGVRSALLSSNLAVVFLLFLSYYWVHQVLQNTMHVTTAGVVGTWWFVPAEANNFWSPALSDSFCRATTYSFGSICFGSLLVAIVQALRALERHTRDKEDFQFLSCIIQCILGCLESMLEGLNRWAYVYVGLYGFSYLEAGRNVMQLFEHKGWTAIITDDLAENVLFMMSVAIGLGSGLVGMVISSMDSRTFNELGFENSSGPGFLVGFLSGFLFASIIMSVVSSGINTVIVCYAEDPASFQMNHPRLSSAMRQAWAKAWPDIVQ